MSLPVFVDAEKRLRLMRLITERGVDGLWLRRRANIAWLANGADVHCDLSTELGIASLAWTPAGVTVLTDDIEDARLRDEELPADWRVESRRWWEAEAPPIGSFASDWPTDIVQELRAPLLPNEIARVRRLGRESAEILEAALRASRAGQTEHETAASIVAPLRARGIHAIVCLVGADERIARYRHPIPTDRRVERVLMAAICAQRQGLIVTATRLVHFGPISSDLRARHDAVCQVDATLHAATRPERRWCDVLGEGIEAYARYGFPDEWTRHHQGGPMGYAARDYKATPSETRLVAPDQLVGWNPSITGTKSEDTILSSGESVTTTGSWPTCFGRPDILRIDR